MMFTNQMQISPKNNYLQRCEEIFVMDKYLKYTLNMKKLRLYMVSRKPYTDIPKMNSLRRIVEVV